VLGFNHAFSGQTWPSVLKDAGLASYVVADKGKSDIFHDFLPLLNGQLVKLLDRKAGTVQEERSVSYLPWRERRRCLSPGPQNAERSRQGRRDAEETGGLTKDVEPSETARQGRGAASRAARFPVRQCGMGQRRRQIRVITQLAQGSLSKNR
jgi:hypothetical protein